MRLLIERHNRWTIEFVRSSSNPLPNKETQLTCNRLTSSSHPSDIDNSGRRRRPRPHTRSQIPPNPKASSVLGGLKLRRYQSPRILQQEAESKTLPDSTADPSRGRRRSLLQRISSISKMLSPPCFRDHNDERAYCYDNELPQSDVQELQADSQPVELETPDMGAWELPTASSSTYMSSSSASTSQDVSPMQGPRRSVSNQHLPLNTNWSSQSHGYHDSSCPSLSPATTLSISPISPLRPNQGLQYDQVMAKQVGTVSPFPGSMSNISAGSGGHNLSPVESPLRNAIDSIHGQLLSPVNTRRGSAATRFGNNLSPVSPSNLVSPTYVMTHDTRGAYEWQQFSSSISRNESPFNMMQSAEGFASPASEARNDQSFFYDTSYLHAQMSAGNQPSFQMRPQRNRNDDLVDMRALVREENGSDEPPPLYSPQVSDRPRMWDATAAHIARREEQVDSGGHGLGLSQGRNEEARGASNTSAHSVQPISCESCGQVFHGRYQKGNWRRHVKQQHTATPTPFRCRDPRCPSVYKRDDARRKHEWKKHRIMDSRPEKRRKDKRIYMPGMTNTQ